MRVRHKPWADDYIKEHSNIVVSNPSQYKGEWSKVFPREAPIHVEIGSGKGQFIAGMGEQNPDINFIGVELVKSVIVTTIDKVKETEKDNIKLLNENAENLDEIFASGEVDTIYLNFSDPWPKNRHEKRRLTYKSFLEKYQKILNENGKIILKTDNRGLFEYSIASFSQFGLIIEEVSLDLHSLNDPTNVQTEYEEKFSKRGQPIYRCIVQMK